MWEKVRLHPPHAEKSVAFTHQQRKIFNLKYFGTDFSPQRRREGAEDAHRKKRKTLRKLCASAVKKKKRDSTAWQHHFLP
ncbi:MAG: hypothetical protein K1Y36_14025 [Blastocatellia bacterium]|nr:hypothetical protein [Blastocatellia bacterium]